MYATLVSLHSYNRWIVCALVAVVIINALIGVFTKKSFGKFDNAISGACIGFTHLQLVLGLVLYFISPRALPFIQANGMKAAMSNADARFYSVEHITMMILAVILIQVGRTRSKRATDDATKHRQLLIFTGLALVLIAVGRGFIMH